MSQIQWICRELVKELDPNELDNDKYGCERWLSRNKQHIAEWIHNPRTQVFMSKKAFVHINCLNRIQVLFRLLQNSFSFSSPLLPFFFFFVKSLLPYIALFESSSPSTCWSSEPSLKYLSLSHLSLLSVSCVGQGNTVQTSSSHKCG